MQSFLLVLSIGAVTNCHKFSALTQHKFIFFSFCRPEAQKGSHRANIKAAFLLKAEGRTCFLAFFWLLEASHISLTCALFPSSKPGSDRSSCSYAASLWQALLLRERLSSLYLLFLKTPRDHIGPTCIIENTPYLKIYWVATLFPTATQRSD